MHIGDHRTDVSSRVRRLLAILLTRILDAVKVVDDRLVEVHRVALVERVYLAAFGDLDVRMGEDEFAKSVVECKAVDTISGRENKIRRGAVPRRVRNSSGIR